MTTWLTRLLKKEAEPPAEAEEIVVELDFARTFPHAFWISSVGRDLTSPHGFRYKVMAVRQEPEGIIDLYMFREALDGHRVKVNHLQTTVANFAGADDMMHKLGTEKSVLFESFDLSHLRTDDDFRARASELGWAYHEPEAAV